MDELKKLIREVPIIPSRNPILRPDHHPERQERFSHLATGSATTTMATPSTCRRNRSPRLYLRPALAYRLGAGFVPVRKPKKLPAKTRSVSYALEYGEDALEVHEDAISSGDRVIICDDLLATGGKPPPL